MQTFHLKLEKEDVAGCDIVLLPGDPDRVEKIAEHLSAVKKLARVREFCSVRGEYHGYKVLVVSTGIGGPSASLCLEELAQLQMKNFLRLGTTGAIQPDIHVGDLILPTACVRYEGTSQHFAPLAYPAVADAKMLQAIYQSSLQCGRNVHLGISCTTDSFYQGQGRTDGSYDYICQDLQNRLQELQKLKVLSFDMENASLFVQSSSYGLRCASLLGVLVNRCHKETPDASRISAIEHDVIETSLQSLKSIFSS